MVLPTLAFGVDGRAAPRPSAEGRRAYPGAYPMCGVRGRHP